MLFSRNFSTIFEMVFLFLYLFTLFHSPLPPLPFHAGQVDRNSIIHSMIHPMYGPWPEDRLEAALTPKKIRIQELATTYYEWQLFSSKDPSRPLRLGVFLPDNYKDKALLLSLNKCGNHTLIDSSLIPETSLQFQHPTRCQKAQRGSDQKKYGIAFLMENGIPFATFAEADMDADSNLSRHLGIRSLYPHDWGTISAWAWGLSQAAQFLQTQGFNKIITTGHSREGKAALLAAALDESIAGVFTNQSGLGGTASLRDSWWRESAKKMVKGYFVYPLMGEGENLSHFFAQSFAPLADDPTKLTFDAHHLIALVAPRLFVDFQGKIDFWAGPQSARRMLTHGLSAWPERSPASGVKAQLIEFPTFHSQDERFWAEATKFLP